MAFAPLQDSLPEIRPPYFSEFAPPELAPRKAHTVQFSRGSARQLPCDHYSQGDSLGGESRRGGVPENGEGKFWGGRIPEGASSGNSEGGELRWANSGGRVSRGRKPRARPKKTPPTYPANHQPTYLNTHPTINTPTHPTIYPPTYPPTSPHSQGEVKNTPVPSPPNRNSLPPAPPYP